MHLRRIAGLMSIIFKIKNKKFLNWDESDFLILSITLILVRMY